RGLTRGEGGVGGADDLPLRAAPLARGAARPAHRAARGAGARSRALAGRPSSRRTGRPRARAGDHAPRGWRTAANAAWADARAVDAGRAALLARPFGRPGALS